MLCTIVELTVNVTMTVLLRSTVMLVKAGDNVNKMHICLAVYSSNKICRDVALNQTFCAVNYEYCVSELINRSDF